MEKLAEWMRSDNWGRNQRSAEAHEYRRLYKTARWRNVRKFQLQRQPLCERCSKRGQIVMATVCHHVNPETKASPFTFFAGPFESLCGPCHDGPTQQVERIGYSTEIGADGWPLDENHPVLKSRD